MLEGHVHVMHANFHRLKFFLVFIQLVNMLKSYFIYVCLCSYRDEGNLRQWLETCEQSPCWIVDIHLLFTHIVPLWCLLSLYQNSILKSKDLVTCHPLYLISIVKWCSNAPLLAYQPTELLLHVASQYIDINNAQWSIKPSSIPLAQNTWHNLKQPMLV